MSIQQPNPTELASPAQQIAGITELINNISTDYSSPDCAHCTFSFILSSVNLRSFASWSGVLFDISTGSFCGYKNIIQIIAICYEQQNAMSILKIVSLGLYNKIIC